jgi:GNAT superfamily N-acetyltransferase
MQMNIITRKGIIEDLSVIKQIADDEKSVFGFITKGTIQEAIISGGIMVITYDNIVVGFQHYYHRKRDLQTTLYHKAIKKEFRGKGLGKLLVDAVVNECVVLGRNKLLLKCPIGLSSNEFHKKYGFVLAGQEIGKLRNLNIWEYNIQDHRMGGKHD